MKLSRKFVSDYIDINDDINTIAEKMTGVGNEYDSAGKLINASNLVIGDRKSTRLNSSHPLSSRMPSSA